MMCSLHRSRAVAARLVAASVVLTSGCLQRDLKELNPCLVSGVSIGIAVDRVEKVDLLFVVDDSKSMLAEQASLRREFPALVRALTTGEQLDAAGNVRNRFPAVTDLHLGVVSTDMGLAGVNTVPSCENGLGGDGKLKNAGSADVPGCDAAYPSYLQFVEGDDPVAVAHDFECVASLGTGGCGFEQQLEAGLKALWPALDIDAQTGAQWIDPDTGQPGNRVSFLPDATGNGALGHGDGYNAGFLRNDRGGESLIGVIVVTDEEDCSSVTTDHFRPAGELPAGDPLSQQPINLRCFHNKQNLYAVERYVNGLKALRPGREHLVVFGAIAGVPVDLVALRDAHDQPTVDLSDAQMRDQWYGRILGDDRMVERIDTTEAVVQNRNLVPSCHTPTGEAYPPRRLVEVAQGFGENGIVQSICQDDFSGAIDSIIEIVARQLGAVCLPRQLNPDADGRVNCEVLWELPSGDLNGQSAPSSCADEPFLHERGADQPRIGDHGGTLCRVEQLDVAPADRRAAKADSSSEQDRQSVVDRVTAAGDGWFYDDFSNEVVAECAAIAPQRITFTEAATPPNGVTVLLECLSEHQSIASDHPDLDLGFYSTHSTHPPEIGDPCSTVPDAIADKASYFNGLTKPGEAEYGVGGGAQCTTGEQPGCDDETAIISRDPDTLCRVRLTDGRLDERMFCDPERQLCVRSCAGDDPCPPAWVCDEGMETPICVNPTCGD